MVDWNAFRQLHMVFPIQINHVTGDIVGALCLCNRSYPDTGVESVAEQCGVSRRKRHPRGFAHVVFDNILRLQRHYIRHLLYVRTEIPLMLCKATRWLLQMKSSNVFLSSLVKLLQDDW